MSSGIDAGAERVGRSAKRFLHREKTYDDGNPRPTGATGWDYFDRLVDWISWWLSRIVFGGIFLYLLNVWREYSQDSFWPGMFILLIMFFINYVNYQPAFHRKLGLNSFLDDDGDPQLEVRGYMIPDQLSHSKRFTLKGTEAVAWMGSTSISLIRKIDRKTRTIHGFAHPKYNQAEFLNRSALFDELSEKLVRMTRVLHRLKALQRLHAAEEAGRVLDIAEKVEEGTLDLRKKIQPRDRDPAEVDDEASPDDGQE